MNYKRKIAVKTEMFRWGGQLCSATIVGSHTVVIASYGNDEEFLWVQAVKLPNCVQRGAVARSGVGLSRGKP